MRGSLHFLKKFKNKNYSSSQDGENKFNRLPPPYLNFPLAISLRSDFEEIKEEKRGIQLVSTLIKQIDGYIKVSLTKGIKYLIKFEKTKHNSYVKD